MRHLSAVLDLVACDRRRPSAENCAWRPTRVKGSVVTDINGTPCFPADEDLFECHSMYGRSTDWTAAGDAPVLTPSGLKPIERRYDKASSIRSWSLTSSVQRRTNSHPTPDVLAYKIDFLEGLQGLHMYLDRYGSTTVWVKARRKAV
jgi:hypothetical protein